MKKLKDKLGRSKLWSAALILCVTIAYLLVTASFAQGDEYQSEIVTGITYKPDQLSYGDIWAFDEATYNASKYKVSASTITYYTDNIETATSTMTAGYYGTLTWDRSSKFYTPPMGTLVSQREYGAYNSGVTPSTVEGVHQEKIPVLTTTNLGTYTVVPHSTTSENYSYRIYVYSAESPAGKVKYHLIDSYTDNNTYAGYSDATAAFEAGQSLSFVPVGNGWWYAEVSIPYIAWEAALLSDPKASGNSSNGSATADYTGSSLTNTKLGTTTNYINNWTYTTVKFNTLLVFQWDKTVQLGPITKEDSIAINNDSNTGDEYSGTVTVTNVFGETIDADGASNTTAHAPLFISVAETENSRFDGFEGAELSPVNGVYGLYRLDFESGMSAIACKWIKQEALPSITLHGNGFTGKADFFGISSIHTSFVIKNEHTYMITPDFSESPGATIDYTIVELGKSNITGTLSKDGDILDIPTRMDTITVTLTAHSASKEITKICTITLEACVDASLPDVVKNGNKKYKYIEDALCEAKSGDTLILLADATFQTPEQGQKGAWLVNNAGYTIATGVKFVVPCSDSDTGVFGSMPTKKYVSTATPNTFRTLTVPAGIKLVCNGDLNVNGHRREDGQGATGTGAPKGAHGKMILQGSGTQLTINGSLSCYGFIVGTGTVEVSAIGHTYELMQIYDWPGGSNAAGSILEFGQGGWKGAADQSTLFLCSRYFGQNIEAPLTVYSGGSMNMEAVITATLCVGSSCTLVGSGGLFQLGEGTYITRSYDPKTDRMTYASGGSGDITLDSITISVSSMSLSSSDYILPLNGALTIHIGDGTTAILDNDFAIMPGCELIVDKGGKLVVSGTMFVFDKADMTAAMSFQTTQIAPLYTAGRGSTATLDIQNSGRLEINGTLEVTGGLYTTIAAGGTASSNTDKKIFGNGKITHSGATDTKTIKAGYSKTLTNISTTSFLGLIQGSSTSVTDLKAFGKNTYYGTGEAGDHYWYVPSLPVYSTDSRNDKTPTIDAEYRLQDYLWLNAVCYLGELTSKIDLSTGKVQVFTMYPDGSGDVNEYENGVFTQDEGVQILAVNGAIYLIKKIPSDEIPDSITFRLEYTDSSGKLYSSIPFTVHLSNCKNGETATDELVDALIEYGNAAKKYFVSGGTPEAPLAYGDTFISTVTGSREKEANAENVYDGKTLKISGMNFLFEERLSLMVAMKFSSSVDETWIKNNVSQMGILVCDKAEDIGDTEIILTAENYADLATGKAFILYGSAEDADSSNIPTLPEYEDYPIEAKATLTADQIAAQLNNSGYATVYMDLLSSQYKSSFKIRPFVIMKDGSILYAPQYEYGLGAYIKTMLAKSDSDLQDAIGDKDVDAFRDLLVTTWRYAEKSVAYCNTQQD